MIDLDATLHPLDTSRMKVLDAPVQTPRQARRHLRRAESKRFVRLQQNRRAADSIGELPPPGCILFGWMDGSYSGWSLIEAIVSLAAPATVDLLAISTLGISRQNIAALFALLDAGTVRRLNLAISHYFRHSDRKIYADLQAGLVARGQCSWILRSHAKFCLFTFSDGRAVDIEGSFNMRSSMNFENFIIVADPDVVAFRHQCVRDAIKDAQCKQQ